MKVPSETYWQNWQKTEVANTTTPPGLYRLNLPALSALNEPKENGPLILQLIILEILDFVGIEWSENQVSECAKLMYEEYYWFTIGELKQISKRIKTGYYGKVFGKFAPIHMMEYFKNYSDEMWEARADFFGGKEKQSPVPNIDPLTPEEEARQKDYFQILIQLAKKFTRVDSEEEAKMKEAKKKRTEEHIAFFKSTLTPEQLQEIENHKIEIKIAAEKYEKEHNINQ